MTAPQGNPLEVFRRYLATKGMHLTDERARVARLALSYAPPVDIERLLVEARSQQSPVSRSTVYRTMAQLKEAGLTFIRPR